MQKFKYKPKPNAGNMRHRVTFLKPPGEVVNGWASKEWSEYVTVWAEIKTLKGARLFEAAAVQMQDMKTFGIRYRDDVSDNMRIRHKGQDYDITSMTNDDERDEYFTILVREVL